MVNQGENIGHLGDNQELEKKRLAEFLARVPQMSAADSRTAIEGIISVSFLNSDID